MSYLMSPMILILSVTLLTSGCAKKKSKRVTGKRPVAQAALHGGTPTPDRRGGKLTPTSDLEDSGSPTDSSSDDNGDGDAGSGVQLRPITGRTSSPTPVESSESSSGRSEDIGGGEIGGGESTDNESGESEPTDDQTSGGQDYHPTESTRGAGGPVDSRNGECGTAFRQDSERWAPGLPNAPSRDRTCTGGSLRKSDSKEKFICSGNTDLVYTDAREALQDGLMAVTVGKANRVDSLIDAPSRELARRIRDVRVSYNRGEIHAQISLVIAGRQQEKLEFRGAGNGRAPILLRAQNSPRGLSFSAVALCLEGSCTNVMMRLQKHARQGKIDRAAYLLVRSGDAHITISEQDRLAFSKIQNVAHANLARYMSNTAYNTCSTLFREVVNGQRQMSACAAERLKKICGKSASFKKPAAESFVLRSWSVAYGRSGFEIDMFDRERSHFGVKGPLLAGPRTPVWTNPLFATGNLADSIERVILMANDGGGNLNLLVDFKGEPRAQTRFSITAINETRALAASMAERARRFPELSPNEIADPRDLRTSEAGEDRAAPAPAARRVRTAATPRAVPAQSAPTATSPGAPEAAKAVSKGKSTSPTRPLPPVKKSPDKAAPSATAKPGAKPTDKTSAKPEEKPEAKPEAKPETKPDPKSEAKPESKPEAKTESKPEPKAEPKAEPKPEVKLETKPEPKAEPKVEPKVEVKPTPTPPAESGGVPPRETEDDDVVQPSDL